VRVSDTARSVAIVLLLGSLAACGKKGPPLAPLRLVPAPVTELGARRSGDDVELRFVLPTANANGPEAIDLGRVEIYAITIAAGAVTPANRDLLTKARVVGTIAVRPPPEEGEGPESAAPEDKRPAPGERVAFVDQLTAEKLMPVALPQPPQAPALKPDAPTTPDPAGQKPDEGTPKPDAGAIKPEAGGQKPAAGGQKPEVGEQKPEAGATAPTPAAPPAPVGAPYPTRVYAIRGLSRSGRPGPASARVVVPIVAPVAPPSAVIAQLPTAQAIVVDWTPPVAEPGTPPLAFNVYRREAAGAPLNSSPVAEAKFEMGGVEYGKELCFVVRTVQAFESVSVESAPSAPACLTPLDKFPPAAPTGLRTVAEDGAVSLVWEQSAEPDLGGYLVLRGEAAGDTLQPLTPQPITDASFRDATVTSGVRYVYAVVAVDTATPRNASAPSAREEVTAR
jgi:predicted small lipoprotein YifL